MYRAYTMIMKVSSRRAADELGIADPDAEFARWLEEQEQITDETAQSENGRVAARRES